jgi:hypothetical protein
LEKILRDIQDDLSEMMRPEFAYLVVEALGPRIRTVLRREGTRMLPALGVYAQENPSEAFRRLWERGEAAGRIRPARLAPARRGPVPLPAPWIAGILVERNLKTQDGRTRELGLDLTAALLTGDERASIKEFEIRRKVLAGSALDRLAKQFENRYERLFREAGSTEKDWWQFLRDRLNCEGPADIFAVDLESVRELMVAYRSSLPKKGPPIRSTSKRR